MQVKNTASLKDFSERLRVALMAEGKNKADLAMACGVSASTVSRWKGKHLPSPVLLTKVSESLDVRREWLAAGLEPMRPNGTSPKLEEPGFEYTTRTEVSAAIEKGYPVAKMITDIRELLANPTPKNIHFALHLLNLGEAQIKYQIQPE